MLTNNVTKQVSIKTVTNGGGYWSQKEAEVEIRAIEMAYCNEEKDFGELRAEFNPEQWNINTDGLIYTDEAWLYGFKKGLIEYGFTADAVNDVSYSEQGMQGDDFVSMDVGGLFIKEWEELFGELELEED